MIDCIAGIVKPTIVALGLLAQPGEESLAVGGRVNIAVLHGNAVSLELIVVPLALQYEEFSQQELRVIPVQNR